MRFILKLTIALSILGLGACASQPTASIGEMFLRQIVFTVADEQWRTSFENSAQHYGGLLETSSIDREVESQITIRNIIKFHRLKKISQWPIEALGVEVVVAEFRPDRKMSDVVSALRSDARVESVEAMQKYICFHIMIPSITCNLRRARMISKVFIR